MLNVNTVFFTFILYLSNSKIIVYFKFNTCKENKNCFLQMLNVMGH